MFHNCIQKATFIFVFSMTKPMYVVLFEVKLNLVANVHSWIQKKVKEHEIFECKQLKPFCIQSLKFSSVVNNEWLRHFLLFTNTNSTALVR